MMEEFEMFLLKEAHEADLSLESRITGAAVFMKYFSKYYI